MTKEEFTNLLNRYTSIMGYLEYHSMTFEDRRNDSEKLFKIRDRFINELGFDEEKLTGDKYPCPNCKGSGSNVYLLVDPPIKVDCVLCKGSGNVIGKTVEEDEFK